MTLIFIVTFYSLLPKAIHVIKSSAFSMWDFDELNTIFIFIELGLLVLTAYSITKLVELASKIRGSV